MTYDDFIGELMIDQLSGGKSFVRERKQAAKRLHALPILKNIRRNLPHPSGTFLLDTHFGAAQSTLSTKSS